MLKADSWKKLRRTALGLSAALLLGTLPFMPSAQAASEGTLLVCTQAGGDVQAAKDALTAAGCTVVSEIPCVEGNFSILQVRPNNGDVSGAVAKFNGRIDANILSAEVTFQSKAQHLGNRWWNWPPRPNCTPNDPDYPSQYALSAMNWNDARCFLRLVGVTQRAYPRVTVIDSGTNSVCPGDELTLVQQFNFAGGQNGTPEANFDPGIHGTGVTSIMACRTHNNSFIAGAASHNLPVKVTTCRVSNDGNFIDTLDVLRAMTWCVDNQRRRGGPGVINLSINSTALPTYNGSAIVQEIAKAARKQGDLFVNGSGNLGLVDPSPELYMRRVAAHDENNMLASFSNTGPFRATAPGVNVALVTSTPPQTLFGTGTSFSGPNWAAGVAFMQSFAPWVNPVRLDRELFATGANTPDGWRMPDFNRAVRSVIYNCWW